MRIRKNAKHSQLLYTTSSLNPSSSTLIQTRTICQLNQSPWDILTFSPSSSPQLGGDFGYGDNVGSLESCIPVVERVDEFDIRGYERECYSGGGGVTVNKEEEAEGNVAQVRKYTTSTYSSSNNSINKKLGNGNSLVETRKQSEKVVVNGGGVPRCPRPKKVSSSKNPHEFYYYSGFGPRWGKKRGGVVSENGSGTNGSNVSGDFGNGHESNSLVSTRFDDDEDVENGEKRKKKARKPIKERSLKSLM